MSPLQLYNTRTRAKQTFVPADPSGQVGLFVCGPTVYDLPHLGHANAYTQFDFLARLPRTRGFAVTYVQNITDVDDKIIRRARELGIDASEVARRYERAYLDDMRALRNDSVDVYARASDYVDQVVSQIERLQEAGAAYATADGIYFDLTAFPDYGRLSGRTNVLRGDPVSRLDANPGDRRRPRRRPRHAACARRALRPGTGANRYRTRKEHARALVRDFLATFALDADAGSAVVDIDVDWLIEEREEHRRNRRFADADRIRDQLAAHGVILEDSPTGVRWRRSTR
jgi:cysteinyl-tRNA synthetase